MDDLAGRFAPPEHNGTHLLGRIPQLPSLVQQNTAGQSLRRFLIGRGIERHGRTADRMPGGDPADEGPGVISPLSQLGHGPTIDLKSANAINHDRAVSRQILDPARPVR